jgi:hypothetical protein
VGWCEVHLLDGNVGGYGDLGNALIFLKAVIRRLFVLLLFPGRSYKSALFILHTCNRDCRVNNCLKHGLVRAYSASGGGGSDNYGLRLDKNEDVEAWLKRKSCVGVRQGDDWKRVIVQIFIGNKS